MHDVCLYVNQVTYANQTDITDSYTNLWTDLKIDTSKNFKQIPATQTLTGQWTLVFPLVIRFLDHCECETDTLNSYFTPCILSIYHTIPSFHESGEEAPLKTMQEK